LKIERIYFKKMTIFGASIGLNMCFFRQTLLSVCLVVPFAVWGQPVAGNDAATTLEDTDVTINILINDSDPDGIDPATVDLDPSSPATIENSISITEGDFSVDATGLVTFSPALDFSGQAIATYTVRNLNATPETSNEATITVTVNAVNDVPTITAITDQTIDEDTQTSILDFTIGDVETNPTALTLTGTSNNQLLVPDANIAFAGSGQSRTVQVTPLADANGVANITITVSDGIDDDAIVFVLTVTAINDAPTITAIGDQLIFQDGSTAVLPFTITDKETPATSLTVTATSDNTTLVPNINIDLQGTGESRTVQVTPAPGQTGTATITITVDDADDNVQETFVLTVNSGTNTPPTITPIVNQTIDEDNSTSAIAFTVGDTETPLGSLVVTGSSDNTALVPNANIVFGGSGASRTVSITPLADQNGTATITLTVNDGTTTAQTTFQVTVNAINDLPTITSIANQTINEDNSSGALAFTVGDVETPLATLSVSGSSNNTSLIPNANIALAGSGGNRTVNVTPLANQSGVATITLTVNDGTATAQTTFQVTVNAVNDLPTITSIANQTINEDNSTGALAFTVGDVETPLATLAVTGSSNNTSLIPNANIALAGSGGNRTVTITPVVNQSGMATITLTVNDGAATAQTIFQVTVNAVNDFPTITPIADQTINANSSTGALAFTVGDVETPVASLAVTGTSDNTMLVPNVNIVLQGSGANRTVQVTPAPGQTGTANITITVDDGSDDVQETFVLTVNAVANTPPTITSIVNQTINEDNTTGALAFTVGDVETPLGSLVVTGSSNNTALVPNLNIVLGGSGASRTVSITPLADQNGMATITLTVDDGTATAQTTFQVTVNAVNDLPTISPIANQTINEDNSTGALAFTVSDVETPLATLAVTGSSDNTSLIPNANIALAGSGGSRTVNVTPLANQSGIATITLTVNDGTATAQTTFQVTVNAVNDLPTITSISNQTINENTSTGALAFTISDVETPLATLAVTGSSNNTSLIPNGNIVLAGSGANRTVNITPLANQSGIATITLTVNDGMATAQTTFQVTVNAVNDPPTITAISNQAISEDGQTGNLAFTVNDPETPAGSLTMSGNSSNPTLVPLANITFGGSGANRTVNVVPVANLSGMTLITLTVSDAVNNVQTAFQVSVTAINDVPTITSISDQTIDENASTIALAFTVGDVETAAGSLNMSGSSGNPALVPNGNIVFSGTGTSRTVTVTPAANQSGVAIITMTVSDGVATAQSSFQLTVNAIDDPPTITSIANQTINEDTQTGPLAFTINDNETPATALTLTKASSNLGLVPNANVVLAGTGSLRNVNVIPALNQNGVTTITLTVSDGSQTAQTAFMVTVTAVDEPPTIVPIADQTISEDTQTGVLALTINDPDTDPNSLTLGGASDNLPLVPNANIVFGGSGTDRTVQVTPVANLSGEANITITVSDGTDTEQIIFKVTVNAVNDAPTITSVADQAINEDSPGTGALAFTVGDVETPGSLVVTRSSSNTTVVPLANVVLGGSGADRTVTVTPAPNQSGTTTITLIVDDGTVTTETEFDVVVTDINDLPQITALGNETITEDQPGGTGAIAFTVADTETPVGSLTLAGASTNPTLVPVSNIVFGGSGANRTVTVTPAANQSGTSTITVTVNDGTGTADEPFLLTVTAVNDGPTITSISNQTLDEDQSGGTGALAFTVDDMETAAGSLTVTRTTNNPTLVPLANAVLGGGGANRTITVTPAANQSGTATITVTVSDGSLTAQTAFDVAVNAVNDDPTITAIADQVIDENTSTGALAFTVGDIETAVGSLTVTRTSNNTTLVPLANIVLGGSGASRNVNVTPATNESGVATISVTVSDGTTSSSTDFDVTVTAVDNPPTITAIADQVINEDVATGSLTFTVGDPDTPVGSLTLGGGSSNTTLVPASNIVFGGSGASRNVTVTPAADQSGVTTITVNVSDGVNTTPETFLLTVNAANDGPTISAIADQTVNEDTPTGVIVFTIADAETAATGLTVTASSSNTALVPNANITLGGTGPSRSINISPAANQSGVTTITINVSDGSITTPRTFQVTVSPANDPPTITAIANQTVVEDTPTGALAFTIGDVETPAGSLTVTESSSNTILVPVANVVLGGSGASRTVTVTPAGNQTGTTTITLTVDDGTSTTSISFTVNVTPVDDPPTISAITNRTINEDSQTGNIAFTVGDPETAAGSLTVTGSSSNTTLVPNANIVLGGTGATRTVNVIPAANQNGTVDITLNVSDGLNSTPTTFQVNVTPVNDGPVITNQIPITIDEGQTVTLMLAQLTVVDPDNVYPTDFSLFVTGGTGYSIENGFTIRPNTNVNGVLQVPIFVSDGSLTSPVFQFQITVNSTNDAPQITGQKVITIPEDQNYSIPFDDLTVIDPDNTTYPTGFTMEILAGTNYTFSGQTITPTPNFNGSLSVNVRVNDGQANSNTWPFVVTITPVNDPPAITNQSPLSTNEEIPITLVPGNFTITDPEPTTYTLNVLPSASPNYTVDGNKITPSVNFYGILSVPVTASDGALVSAQFNAQITVNPVNDLPQILSQLTSLSTVEDTPITLALSHLDVSDVDGNYPTGFTLIVEAGPNYTFSGMTVTPGADFVGTLDVVVRVNDGVANSPQFTVQIEVTDDADAPVINGQNPVAIAEDGSREITLADLVYEDPDTDAAQLTVSVQDGTNYTLEGNTVIPLPNFFGTLTVPVMINDGEANSNLFQMQVTVNAVNDAPNFNQPGNVTINEDAAQQSLTITGISAGPLESQVLSLIPISDNTELIPHPIPIPTYNGTAPTATITFRPEPNMYGVAIISVRVIDGPLDVVKTFTITVNPINDAPTLQPIANVTIIEDAAEQIISLTGISPGGGLPESTQTLDAIVSNIDKPELLEVIAPIEIAAPNGSLRIKPKPNAHGVIQITIRVRDNGPGSPPPNVNFVNRTFTLTIESVNDPVVFTSNAGLFAEPGILYTYNVEATDNDGDVITLTAPTKPAWLTLTQVSNGKATLSGTPPPGPGGDVVVVLEATDPTGPPLQQPYTLTVNSRPVLTPILVTTSEDTPHAFNSAEFTAGFDDVEGNSPAELEITDLPTRGTLTYNNSAVTVGTKIPFADLSKLVYTPAADSTGQDTLRWNASDGFNMYSTNDTYVLLNVTPVNDLPIINIPESDVAETDTLKYELGSEIPVFVSTLFEGKDPDGDNITGATIGFKQIDNFVYRSENDRLIFAGTAKITGDFDEGSGVLNLNGVATAQEYVDAIRSIKYNYEDTRELLLDTRSVYVSLSDGQGTSLQESRIITLVYTFSDLDIPTAFTPNGDEANETWKITAANGTAQYDEAEVKVYNKRGLLLFETRGFERQWDGVWNGETLPSDTYFYTIELNYNKVRYKGTVTILR
jgi:gliding motility-associated-like protein